MTMVCRLKRLQISLKKDYNWRKLLDPRDPDYLDVEEEEIPLDIDYSEMYNDDLEYDGPEDYEGTMRYHY